MKTIYLAITPAHNEEQFIGNLLSSVIAQTCHPSNWLIIDDGSTDATGDIIDSAALDYPWITPLHLPVHEQRAPGGESVVMAQLNTYGWAGFNYIFRVDADITFNADYVEALLTEFKRNDRLGIASGMLYEPSVSGWQPNREPSFQATGNCRIYSRRCFETIGGLESGLGWDTIDVTKALMLGFQTRNFEHLPIFHHRPMQSASGRGQGWLNMGEAAYNAGYSPLFIAARALKHVFAPPRMSGGALMLFAYLRCWVNRRPIVTDRELIKFVRRQQLRRLFGAATLWR
jgi:glycosyltransferase involved in cell wall biosynthesis